VEGPRNVGRSPCGSVEVNVAKSPSGSKDACMRRESKVLGMGVKLHTQIKGPRIVGKSLRESQKACMR